jgi:hypothetical protein
LRRQLPEVCAGWSGIILADRRATDVGWAAARRNLRRYAARIAFGRHGRDRVAGEDRCAVLPLLSRREPQLLGLLTVFGWVATLLAILAILMARQAERRIQLTRDKRGMMTAQLGLWLGWATVAYTALSLVTWPIRQVTSNL